MRSSSTILVVVLLCGVAVSGCQGARSEPALAQEQVKPSYDSTGRLTRLEADSDHDGRIDTWAYMDGPIVVRVEVDENGDGTVDRWEYHRTPTASTAGGASQTAAPIAGGRGRVEGPDKTIERIERATRHDGVVSRKEYFDNGMLTRVEEDTDGDGKIDKWETYRDGSLSMMAIDTQHRGTPDRRLIYRPGGALDRIETDPTGSGTFRSRSVAEPRR